MKLKVTVINILNRMKLSIYYTLPLHEPLMMWLQQTAKLRLRRQLPWKRRHVTRRRTSATGKPRTSWTGYKSTNLTIFRPGIPLVLSHFARGIWRQNANRQTRKISSSCISDNGVLWPVEDAGLDADRMGGQRLKCLGTQGNGVPAPLVIGK